MLAPYNPGANGVADYAVQAEIQLVRYSDDGAYTALDSFGLLVRSPSDGGGYQLGICASSGLASCGKYDHEANLATGSQIPSNNPLQEVAFRPGYGNWHTYRMEVKGNTIKVLIDGGVVFQTTDNTYLDGGQVGLWSDRCQVSVRQFTITAL